MEPSRKTHTFGSLCAAHHRASTLSVFNFLGVPLLSLGDKGARSEQSSHPTRCCLRSLAAGAEKRNSVPNRILEESLRKCSCYPGNRRAICAFGFIVESLKTVIYAAKTAQATKHNSLLRFCFITFCCNRRELVLLNKKRCLMTCLLGRFCAVRSVFKK
jgi:hypothetical protein